LGTQLGVVTAQSTELHESGEQVGALGPVGSLTCIDCGFAVSLVALEALPNCPTCGGSQFKRGSIFEQPTVDSDYVAAPEESPAWLDDLREELDAGLYLAYDDGGEPVLTRLVEGWIRIGRSAAADLVLDDPTVSRRHAIVVRTPQGDLRALDDRSLNGLFVNGEQVDWVALSDGDELEIGCYRLHVLDV
jgi:predicted  nucleic acid-binding Zn-ribbon protein